MKLVLAEKPSVAQSIAKVLGAAKREDGYLEGNGYVVSWCVGHLVELAQPEVYDAKYSKWAYADLPIFPMDWQYEVSAGTKKQFGILKKLMAREDVASLVCATDAGREGELIFRLVYHKAGCRKPFERLWISSMEDVAIKEGFENLRSGTEYDALYEAALCRERADWIVGINATRLFSTLYGQTLNVGRVMTPTLAMAVMREAAISAFKPELFYTVQIGLDGFTAASERFKTKAAAEAVKQSCSVAIVQKAECKEKTEKPPALYDLTSLQREANRVLGYTAQQTLDYTQNLYEKKLVTYPRTDSRFLTEDMAHSLTDLVKLAFHTFPVEDVDNIPVHAEQVVNNKKVTDEQESGTFIPPSAKTVNDLLDEYMSIYGVNTWAMSTYESRKSLIANYIRPLIGDMKLEDVTPRIMDKYYRDLLSVKAVSSKYVKARTEYLTPHTVREVHKTLRNAFNQAVKWELMTRNPVEHATLPKEEHKTRDIWTAEVLQKALEACDDDILRLAINLAFSCSLRMGELLGLTWDCIDISPTSIELGQASIFVEKELQRVNREAMADLDGKDIMFKFPPTFASTHTALVLKTPKTKTSVRKVFLPKTVAEMLVQRKADIEELKDLFGDEFVDFNLVFCSSNGKPIEGQVINRAFNKLIEEKGLPKVVFHSLRHSSITYKLKLNGGDMKSVQGDSGHAQVKMVADVYSHIIDDDRRLNAERMEAAFYSGRQATPEPVQPAATESSADDKELLLKLLQNPEMAALLKSLAKTL